MITIEEAKSYLRKKLDKGITCPCCNQTVKMYKVKLTTGMAQVLIKFYKNKGWKHPIEDFKTINGDYAKLRHWGLVEKHGGEHESDVKSNGLWRITLKGIDFIQGSVKVPEKIKLYNNNFYGFDGDKMITIRQALGNKFDFEELINS